MYSVIVVALYFVVKFLQLGIKMGQVKSTTYCSVIVSLQIVNKDCDFEIKKSWAYPLKKPVFYRVHQCSPLYCLCFRFQRVMINPCLTKGMYKRQVDYIIAWLKLIRLINKVTIQIDKLKCLSIERQWQHLRSFKLELFIIDWKLIFRKPLYDAEITIITQAITGIKLYISICF